MKIVLTTSLVAVLAIGLLGISNSGNNINNAFAQGDGIMGNDTGMMGNDTGMTMNATLAYAQEDEMIEMDDEDMMIITMILS